MIQVEVTFKDNKQREYMISIPYENETVNCESLVGSVRVAHITLIDILGIRRHPELVHFKQLTVKKA